MTTPLGALPRLSPSTRRALWLSGLLATINAVAMIVQAWALAHGLATVVTSGSAAIGDDLAMLATAILVRAGLAWAVETVSARAAADAKAELRAHALDSALAMGPEWIASRGPAQVATLATKGLDALDAYFTRYLPALVTAAVVPPLVGAWILLADWVSALAIVCTVPLIPLFAWLVGRFTQKRTVRAADTLERLSGHLLELVRALPVLSAFGRAAAQRRIVAGLSESHRRTSGATLRVAFLSALVLELLSSLSVAVVAVGIGLRLVSGDLDLTTGLLVLVLAPECYLPLRAVGAAHHASEDGVEAVRRIDEIEVSSSREIDARPGRRRSRASLTEHHGTARTLQVRRLSVRRRDGYAPDGLTFTAGPGDIVHLDGFDGIGPSGSGKSSTFAALLGFAEPAGGSIAYGDVDIRELAPETWRRHIAWVPQRPAFTGGTVADELDVALSDQSTHPEPVEALAEVGATHLLRRRVDELSTGERQRVAVARALLRLRADARLLLLDEPTAHLDATAARGVTAAFRRAADDGAAVVLASHRPTDGAAGSAPTGSAEPAAATGFAPTATTLRELVTRRSLFGVCLGAMSLLAGLALTAASAWLIARAAQQPPVLTLTVAVVGVRTFALSRAGLRYVERLVTHDAAFRLAGRLRCLLWDAVVRLGPVRAAELRRDTGLARLVDDVDTVRDLVPRVLVPPLVAVVVAAGAVAVEVAVLPEAGLLLAVALLFAGVAGPAAGVFAERHASARLDAGRRRVTSRVFALLDGAAELIACGADRAERAELAENDRELTARARRAAYGAGVATALITLSVGAAVLGGAWLAAQAVAEGRLAAELAPLLALVPLAAAEAVTPLPQAAQQHRALRGAQERLAPLLAAMPSSTATPPERSDGDVVLSGVQVRWRAEASPTLRGGTARVPSGTHAAVVGPSGGGKSTLLAVLLGFLAAERGVVRAPSRVAWCPQEPHLVSTTVRENLRMAQPGASDERLAEVLELAGLPGWKDRLDELVGAGGTALSGGEAQRLALARALLRDDAELFLFDEPTAHLDEATARELLNRLRHALRGRTVVHVTHRWVEAELADVVLRVEDGLLSEVPEAAYTGASG